MRGVKRVEFVFNEQSLVSLEVLKQQGFKFIEVKVGERKIIIPVNDKTAC